MSLKKRNERKIRSIQKREIHRPTYNMEFPKDENGFIYVRQSSIAQLQKNLHSFEMQTEKFLQYFRSRGCTGHIEIIADDEGMSGTKDIHEMPGLTRVMRLIEGKELLHGKKVGWGAAVHVNRFTRDKWLVKPGTIMRACYENDVWLATLRMDFNFQDEYCQRVFMIEAEESARHLEWMKLVMGGGKAAASDKGYYDGRWIVPGYIVDRSDEQRKKYIIYEPHAEVVRWLFQRYLELDGNLWGLFREVEKMPFLFPKFEEWVDAKSVSRFVGNRKKQTLLIQEGPYAGNYKISSDGIRSILCNPVYIGWWLPINGGVVENNHEAIVEEALFTYAHKRLSTYDLNGERQKPARVTRNGEAKGLLKKVLRDDNDKPMYAIYDVRHNKQPFRYKSFERNSLLLTFRYSVCVEQLDSIFLEKFFERITMLEKLDDWKDKLDERQAAREAKQEYSKSLVQKQINNARRQRKEILDLLKDPDIPKTKQMKIDYAEQIAGLEEKIAQWESDLESTEGEEEDEEVTLYEIHSLLPDIASQWNKLPFDVRLRFVGALVQKVVLSQVAPSWLKVEIYWKEVIGNFVDTGHFQRDASNRTIWSQEEIDILRQMFPMADAAEILEALPDRSWKGITYRAQRLGIKRERGARPNSIHVTRTDYRTLEDKKYEEENGLSSSVKNVQWFS
jgi:hypothetical protein